MGDVFDVTLCKVGLERMNWNVSLGNENELVLKLNCNKIWMQTKASEESSGSGGVKGAKKREILGPKAPLKGL